MYSVRSLRLMREASAVFSDVEDLFAGLISAPLDDCGSDIKADGNIAFREKLSVP